MSIYTSSTMYNVICKLILHMVYMKYQNDGEIIFEIKYICTAQIDWRKIVMFGYHFAMVI